MGQLIDSSAFVALERGGYQLSILTASLLDEPVALASITASELLAGVHRANTADRRLRREAFVETVLATVPILPFDLASARVHARIWMELAVAGKLIGAHDLIIAATALTHGYGVVTKNQREFQRVPGLVVQQLILPGDTS